MVFLFWWIEGQTLLWITSLFLCLEHYIILRTIRMYKRFLVRTFTRLGALHINHYLLDMEERLQLFRLRNNVYRESSFSRYIFVLRINKVKSGFHLIYPNIRWSYRYDHLILGSDTVDKEFHGQLKLNWNVLPSYVMS